MRVAPVLCACQAGARSIYVRTRRGACTLALMALRVSFVLCLPEIAVCTPLHGIVGGPQQLPEVLGCKGLVVQ